MKGLTYAFAGLAVVAAIGALVFRPPHSDSGTAFWNRAAPAVPAGAARALLDDATLDSGGGNPHLASGRAHGSNRPALGREQIVVYVAGAVVRPGVYSLASGARAQDALIRAGGAKADADLVAVNLAARLEDGMEIAVPKIGDQPHSTRRARTPRSRGANASHGRSAHRRRAAVTAEDLPPLESIDLNAANESELEALPGVGPALAARIVAYREMNGPFTSVDELADISGITPALQEKITNFVTVR